jgi:hypothetical protein
VHIRGECVCERLRTIFVANAHRSDGKRFVVRAEEKLTVYGTRISDLWSGGGEGGTGGGSVEAFGTVTAALQFGHGAVTPIWAGVADRC